MASARLLPWGGTAGITSSATATARWSSGRPLMHSCLPASLLSATHTSTSMIAGQSHNVMLRGICWPTARRSRTGSRRWRITSTERGSSSGSTETPGEIEENNLLLLAHTIEGKGKLLASAATCFSPPCTAPPSPSVPDVRQGPARVPRARGAGRQDLRGMGSGTTATTAT